MVVLSVPACSSFPSSSRRPRAFLPSTSCSRTRSPPQPPALLPKAGNAEQLAQDDPRVVEAQGLVEVARQQVSLHRSCLMVVQVENSTPPAGDSSGGGVGTPSCHPAGRLAQGLVQRQFWFNPRRCIPGSSPRGFWYAL